MATCADRNRWRIAAVLALSFGCGDDVAPPLLDAAVAMNECALGTHDCSADAACVDTPSSFECMCAAGFVGDGHGAEGCLSDDASLVSLVPSVGTLRPAFASTVTEYRLDLPLGAAELAVTPTAADPERATIQVDGAAVASGTLSPATAPSGSRPIAITVRAASGTMRTYTVVPTWGTYVKASNTGMRDGFGAEMAISNDGSTLAVGARMEDSSATGIDGNPNDDAATDAGAVYVFVREGGAWRQQAYVKASNTDPIDYFGFALALSGDGSSLAVGAYAEDSISSGVDGDQTDESASLAGAVYVFTRTGDAWSQEAYIKASNPGADDIFGASLTLSGDGATLAVGAQGEDSNASGVNADQTNDDARNSGAVYVFSRAAGVWSQDAYVKAPAARAFETFGRSVALDRTGSTLAIGTSGLMGGVYVYTRDEAGWAHEATIDPAGRRTNDGFGVHVALSGDGATLAVGAYGSAGYPEPAASAIRGAVYVFDRAGATWTESAYVQALESQPEDAFGAWSALSSDGSLLAVAAPYEQSGASGIDGDESDNTAPYSGAAYLFVRASGSWTQTRYVKATNTSINDRFGSSIALSGDGSTLAVGAEAEDSGSTGIGGDLDDERMQDSGAVFVY